MDTQSSPLLSGSSQVPPTRCKQVSTAGMRARLDASQSLLLKDNQRWLKPFDSWTDQNDRNGVSD